MISINQGQGNYMVMKEFNFMHHDEIDILRKSSQKKLGILRGAF